MNRSVVLAKRQLRRLVKAGLVAPRPRPNHDAHKSNEGKNGHDGSQSIDVHGCALFAVNAEHLQVRNDRIQLGFAFDFFGCFG